MNQDEEWMVCHKVPLNFWIIAKIRKAITGKREGVTCNSYVVSRNFTNIRFIRYRLKMVSVRRLEPGFIAKNRN